MSISCSRCQSEDVMRCEMAYAQGTTVGTISGGVIGASIGGGGVSPILGGGSVGTMTQSILAKYVVPPTPPAKRFNFGASLGFLLIGLPMAVVCVRYAMANQISSVGVVLLLAVVSSVVGVLVGSVVGGLITGKRGESKEELAYRKDVENWQRKWICLKCGELFYLD